ncbi:MAG TPA: TorF family putative porin [Pseudolabrys sp.]|nr:TorF family putative porin [Pseudolabrys sp.]
MQKKFVMSMVAALALCGAAPAFAADMPVKAAPAPVVAPAPSPFDVAFGTTFTTDYRLRGISQTDRNPAIQGFFEADYTATPWLTLYAGLWGSNVSFADAEFDISGGGRFTYGIFGLDLGFVYYEYPGPTAGVNISYGEFYAKPSVKVTDWLTLNGQIYGGDNWGNTGNSAWWYAGGATITLPQFMPLGITTSLSGNVGYQTYASAIGNKDYAHWDAGVTFGYKAVSLDLRYIDTNIGQNDAPAQCNAVGQRDICGATFLATLSFNTSLSALK